MSILSVTSQTLRLCFWHLEQQEQHYLFELCRELNSAMSNDLGFLWRRRVQLYLEDNTLPVLKEYMCWKSLYKTLTVNVRVLHYIGEPFSALATKIGIGKTHRSVYGFLRNWMYCSIEEWMFIKVLLYISKHINFDSDILCGLITCSLRLEMEVSFDTLLELSRGKYIGGILRQCVSLELFTCVISRIDEFNHLLETYARLL